MLFPKNFVFFVVIIMGFFFHCTFFVLCEIGDTYKIIRVKKKVPHLNNRQHTCSKTSWVYLAWVATGQGEHAPGASRKVWSWEVYRVGVCAGWF